MLAFWRISVLFLVAGLALGLAFQLNIRHTAHAQESGIDLAVSLDHGASNEPTMVVGNYGVEDAEGVQVTIEYPGNTAGSLSLFDPPTGRVIADSDDPSRVIWVVGKLPARSQYTMRVRSPSRPSIITEIIFLHYVVTVNSEYPYLESNPGNERAELWKLISRDTTRDLARTAHFSVKATVDNRIPEPGSNVVFDIALEYRGKDTRKHRGRWKEFLKDPLVKVHLTEGLTYLSHQEHESDTAYDAATRRWNIESFEVGPDDVGSRRLTLTTMLADGAAPEEQCLTAEATTAGELELGINGDAPLSDNTAELCLGAPVDDKDKIVLDSGEVAWITWYDCVSETAYPCDTTNNQNDDGLELVIEDRQRQSEDPAQPRNVVFQVPASIEYRGVSNGSVVWSTGYAGDHEGSGARPGIQVWYVADLDIERWGRPNPTYEGFVFGDYMIDLIGAPESGAMEAKYLYLGSEYTYWSIDSNTSFNTDLNTLGAAYASTTWIEFNRMGTYMTTHEISAFHDGGTDGDTSDDVEHSDSETYTFHVGPVADLEARAGDSALGVGPGQMALTVLAVNNGPDHALDAEVDIDLTLPNGVTVASHDASEGTYDETTGKWDLGVFHDPDYRRAWGEPEAETLTLILEGENAASATATATIANVKDYSVCIDSSSGEDVAAPNQAACEGVTGQSWHTTPVYDHIDGNNTATLTARPGTGEVGPDTPAAGPQPPRSVPAGILVEWRPVLTLNSWPVSHYEVERSSSDWQPLADNVACPADATICRYVDTTAQTGQMYSYRVRAVNALGVPGPWSRPMTIGRSITAGAPEAPDLTATANGRTEIGLTWDKPIENGSSIISYTVQVADRSNGPWAAPTDPAPSLGPNAISWTHEGLLGGTRKYYRLRATNSQGDSPWSGVVNATTKNPIAPGQPVNLAATPEGDTVVLLSWGGPADDGAAPIQYYEAQWSADAVGWTADTARWRGAGRTSDGKTLSLRHTGLKPGESVHYRARARNRAGWGDWSATATAHPPTGVPAAPALTAQGHRATEIKLSWTKPVDRGSEILRYELQVSEDGGSNWSDLANNISADATEYVHSGLTDGAARHYRIRAVNGNGAGGWSRVRSATTKAQTPGPIQCPTESVVEDLEEQLGRELSCSSPPLLLADDRLIIAEWGPPEDDGGLPITGYSVEYRRSGGGWQTWLHGGLHTNTWIFEHSDGSPLTNGRRYDVRVAAVNAKGTGRYAQASAVPNLPPGAPGEPRNVVPAGGHGRIVVTWREPWNTGHPELTGYRVQFREEGTEQWLPVTPISATKDARSETIVGLSNGTTYQVQVWAVNSAGDSPKAGADGALKATPWKVSDGDERPPTNPRNLRLSPGSDRITASWSAPADRGNPAFAGYQVQYRCRWCSYDEWGDWTTFTESTTGTQVTITGLGPEMDYQVQVKTVDNGYGSGLAIAQTTTR